MTFSPSQISARIEALARRHSSPADYLWAGRPYRANFCARAAFFSSVSSFALNYKLHAVALAATPPPPPSSK